MKTLKISFILLIALTGSSYAMSEADKIKVLLDVMERSNLIFIRNDSEHSSKEARDHLEKKLSSAWGGIQTARQFIKYIGTKSSISGKFYYVKFPDGKKIKSFLWLKQKLLEIEKKK